MALTPEQIDACFDGLMPSGHGKSRYDIACAIEAEVRKQDEALIRRLVEALENADRISGYPNNKRPIAAGRARLEGKP